MSANMERIHEGRRRRVTGVTIPRIVGVFFVQRGHIIVAIGLGQHRSGGDRQVFRIALHDGGVRYFEHLAHIGFETVAVDNNTFGTKLQTVECAVHGQDSGVQDVDPVNFFRINHTDRPRQSILLDDRAQRAPPGIGQLFRIVEQFVVIVRRKNDCCGIDRTGQTTATGFVATGLEQSHLIVVSEQH